MRRTLKACWIIFIFTLLHITSAYARNAPSNKIFLGYSVRDLHSGAVIDEHNANINFTPASVNKLLVSLAILEELGQNYKYKTILSTNSNIAAHTATKNNSIDGNIILSLSADPSLSHENLEQLFKPLANKIITGNIIINSDDSNDISYAPGWIWDDLSYMPPITNMLLDQDRFHLRIISNGKIKLATDLPKNILQFNNLLVQTNAKNCLVAIYPEIYGYQARGCLTGSRQKNEAIIRELVLRDPQTYFKYWLDQIMLQQHIKLSGKIIIKNTHPGKIIISEHKSKNLASLLTHMLAVSDNVYAEEFLKKIARENKNSSSLYFVTNYQRGAHAVKEILRKVDHLNLQHITYDDGSGLSRYDALNPKFLSSLLVHARRNAAWPTWKKIIAKYGAHNTILLVPFKLPKHYRLIAKTGSMTGVLSLAGYMEAPGKRAISFAIMLNGIYRHNGYRRWLGKWITTDLKHLADMQPLQKYPDLPATPYHKQAWHKSAIKWRELRCHNNFCS